MIPAHRGSLAVLSGQAPLPPLCPSLHEQRASLGPELLYLFIDPRRSPPLRTHTIPLLYIIPQFFVLYRLVAPETLLRPFPQPHLAVFPIKRDSIAADFPIPFRLQLIHILFYHIPAAGPAFSASASRSWMLFETFNSRTNAFPRRDGLLTQISERPLPDSRLDFTR